jgi:hypothetical protein
MLSSCASANINGEINVWSPKWFAKNVRQVCDRVVGRPCRYRETVRSDMAIPSFDNSPWIRGAPQRQFSAAIRRIRSRQGESMRGLPGRRERRRQHRRRPSRCQCSTVAGWSSTSASRHRGHNHRKNSQNSRSAGRKRLFERARTPSWWRRARVSSRRSRRVTRADRTGPPVLMTTARIACRVPVGDATVNDLWAHAILARHTQGKRLGRPRLHPAKIIVPGGSVRAAAVAWGVSKTTAARWIREGRCSPTAICAD